MIEQIRDAARRTVCANAENASEAMSFMWMLGIFPGVEDEYDESPRTPIPLNKVNK